jgi:hypothetical protein
VIIDNVPPVINSISSTGNETHVIPGESVDFVADITALLVTSDDMISARYEYSGQPVGTVNRQWSLLVIPAPCRVTIWFLGQQLIRWQITR